jgi:hypothetical protein
VFGRQLACRFQPGLPERLQIVQFKPHPRIRLDPLHRAVWQGDEACPQSGMARHHRIQHRLKLLGVDRAAHAIGSRHVVFRPAGRKLIEKPEALLLEGKRAVALFLAATDRLGCHIGEKFRLLLA